MFLLYGAYGYTGRRIAIEAAGRGLKPVLAGRDAQRLAPLSAQFACPQRAFPLDTPESIAGQLSGVRAVLNCAGPFSATAEPLMEACLRAGIHYLDVTGEIEVIEAAAGRDAAAREAGIAMIPAVGFDVVPSDCLAAMLAARLPAARLLQLAFAGIGPPSPGTTRTMLEGLPRGGRARIDGRIARVPLAWKSREIPFPAGRQWAMTIPWGDVASAWHTTGIPNIEVYLALPRGKIAWLRRLRWLIEPVLRLLPAAVLVPVVHGFATGSQTGGEEMPCGFWGRVADDKGVTVEATLETLSSYRLTVLTALAALERVLAGRVPPGFHTPARAFGQEFILEIPGSRIAWH